VIKPIFITGSAGTGKTTKLLGLAAHHSAAHLKQPHQRLLAMAYMHGARRRLDAALEKDIECKKITRLVSTIDSFSLSLLNKWRTALGLELPICPTPPNCTKRFERHGRLHLPFDQIAHNAACLLKHNTVAKIVAASFPLVIIDEFQDCHGPKLEIVKALSVMSQLIIAADPYQHLEASFEGCPAVDWLEGLCVSDLASVHRLTKPHRFANSKIFEAATCIRDATPPANDTILFYQGNFRQAAFWIMDRLQLGWRSPKWSGTTAIISPSVSGDIEKLLKSMRDQQAKRKVRTIKWLQQRKAENEQLDLCLSLGVTSDYEDNGEWLGEISSAGSQATEVVERTRRFAHLKGIRSIPKHLVTYVVEQVINGERARRSHSDRFVVSTIHGAKNCEFDNVVVIWTYELPPGTILHSRLLYNAITRAKQNCVLIDLRSKKSISADSVVALVGPAKPIFDAKPAKKKSKSKWPKMV
jgi:superfamily I DNA/RNA helicase